MRIALHFVSALNNLDTSSKEAAPFLHE